MRPGTHITAMGSDQAEKNELTLELLKESGLFCFALGGLGLILVIFLGSWGSLAGFRIATTTTTNLV